MSVETVRPAGAGHETLYVLLGSLLILALAATVVGLRQQSHEAQALDAHQVDARLDLNAAEQGIYADLQVAAEDIQARLDDGEAAPPPPTNWPPRASRPSSPTSPRAVAASTAGAAAKPPGVRATWASAASPGWPARSSCCSAPPKSG